MRILDLRRRRGAVPMSILVVVMLATSGCTSSTIVHASASPSPSVGHSSAAPKPTPKPTPDPSSSLTAANALAALIAKLPHFGTPPPVVPVRAPAGPFAPIYYRLPVTAPVAFLTIDDGIDQMPEDLKVMAAAHIRFTMFLIGPVAARNPPFFKQLVADGGVIEDHTMTHPNLRGQSAAFQKNQICGAKTLLTKSFGSAPTLFRPPFGDYDDTTLQLVHDCGLKAAFYWSETVRSGKVYYQTSVHKIKAGDIILMHFRPQFPEDVLAALTAIHNAGLTPALLEDYIGQPLPPAV